MGKKQELIADKVSSALDDLMFDKVIDIDERQELSRKLGVVWDIPDLLTYADLREIAIEALAMNAMADAVYDRQQSPEGDDQEPEPEEVPPPPAQKLVFECKPRAKPLPNGEDDVKGVDTC